MSGISNDNTNVHGSQTGSLALEHGVGSGAAHGITAKSTKEGASASIGASTK